MTVRLKEKGRFFELPIVGLHYHRIIYDGLLRIVFADQVNSYLDFHGEFILIRYNQTFHLDPGSKEALLVLYDLFKVRVTEAKADKAGKLFLQFENGVEILVEDGPYENWHYTKITPGDSLHVHGGVGRTTF